MSPEIEWIIEHDDLPPDQTPLPLPPPPRRRRPGRLWLLVGLTLLSAILVYWLWQLGGQPPPKPQPDEPKQAAIQLETAVQLEISALNNGDKEIFERLQDTPTRRQSFELPYQLWFGNVYPPEMQGELKYLDSQVLDDKTGRAQVGLTWLGESYELNWFYRVQNDRWLHTDWLPNNLGPKTVLSSTHVTIDCHQPEAPQLEALVDQLENYIVRLCRWLPCPAEPFQVVLHSNPVYSDYSVDVIPATENTTISYAAPQSFAPHYFIPSPLRLRWPSDGQPEPLLLGSIGRHLVHDLYLAQVLPNLDEENQVALTLVSFWLTHDLLNLETLPTTRWLDEWVDITGKGKAGALIRALAQNASLSDALTEAFAVNPLNHNMSPDYFGLLAMMDPKYLFTPYMNTFPPIDQKSLLERLDWQADPWDFYGETFNQVLPVVTQLRHHNGWTMAYNNPFKNWPPVLFFRPEADHWVLAPPDETLMGPLHTSTFNHFTLTYWEWDQAYLDAIATSLEFAYRKTLANFGIELDFEHNLNFILTPGSNLIEPPLDPDSINRLIVSPSAAARHKPGKMPTHLSSAVQSMVEWLLIVGSRDTIQFHWCYGNALITWQGDQIAAELGLDQFESKYQYQRGWVPPKSLSSEEWIDLTNPGFWDSAIIITADGQAYEPYPEAKAIIDYILETYGIEKLPVILNTLRTESSMDEWITIVTGRPLAEFEPAWRQWVIDQNFHSNE